MLIKSLFNLEVNSTVSLPNEYFAMLQKEEKYQELQKKLLKLNHCNQRLIESISTIKKTLNKLVNEFIKPEQNSLVWQIEFGLNCAFQSLDSVCSNFLIEIERKLFNYHNQIEKLNRNYKEKLQLATHYKRKVESIRKGGFQTKDQKQKLSRNISKKRTIQAECQKAEKLLIENYEDFHRQTQDYLRLVPCQILTTFVEGNLAATTRIIETLDDEGFRGPKRPRRQSIMSSIISEISDMDEDALSQYSVEDLTSNEIPIVNQFKSDQILHQNIGQVYMTTNQSIAGSFRRQDLKGSKLRKSNNKNLRKSILRSSSIQKKIRNKPSLIQKVKTILETQTNITDSKNLKSLELQKTFQKIKSPLTHAQKIKKLFRTAKNKFCDSSQISLNKNKHAEKTTPNYPHETTFLEKQQFKKQNTIHIIRNNSKNLKHQTKNQQTINQPSDKDENPSTKSPAKHDNSVSISSELSNRLKDSIRENFGGSNQDVEGSKGRGHFQQTHLNRVKIMNQRIFPEIKVLEKKRPYHVSTELHQHSTYNHLPNQQFGSIQQIKTAVNSSKQGKLGEAQKKKIIEHLFSVPSQKLIKINELERKTLDPKSINIQLNAERISQKDLKYWFSTAFLTPGASHQGSQKIDQISNDQNLTVREPKLSFQISQTQRAISTSNKIDFSIFDKII